VFSLIPSSKPLFDDFGFEIDEESREFGLFASEDEEEEKR